ncbi:MAG: putative monovalent cation/H+ antiporter subunit A [Anaerolineae bacterium]|nr:putative monovalent cation/H+ antiporter subunit A [Anaerolineae bacterium]
MLMAVLAGYAVALLAGLLVRVQPKWSRWLLALLPLALTIYFGQFIPSVAEQERLSVSYTWVPSLGINLSFALDGLSLLFALLVSGVGALIIIYAGGYLGDHPLLGRFYGYLLMFMASMLGLVLADNILTLFIFWELTSFASYLLIGFDHEQEKSRKAALQALLVTGGGGLALLAGLLLLGIVGGSFELGDLLAQREAIQGSVLYAPLVILILLGAFTKSAQFPFHFWLPGAMAAPTPVSAYLHSATMVKVGIYLLARLSPILGATALWQVSLTVVGAVTMVMGAYLAWQQTDLKRILAYSTVSSLGLLVLLIGVGSKLAFEAAMLFVLTHALYKGTLFLVAGIIDHETGTRDVDRLGGLRRILPLTALAAGLAALSMAGFPPLIGFISKELTYETLLEGSNSSTLLLALTFVSNVLLVAIAGILFFKPFMGKLKEFPHQPHGAPLSLWLGPTLLSLLGVIVAVVPSVLANPLVASAATAALGKPVEVELALWHGVTPILIASAATLALGAGFYLLLPRLRLLFQRLEPLYQWGPAKWYEWLIDGMNWLASTQTRLLQNGYLRIYLMVILATTTLLAGYSLLRGTQLTLPDDWSDVRFYEVGLGLLILAATAVATQARSRLAAVAALGVVGYSISLLYVLFSAPDLAMTQFTIETLSVILFVLVLYRLPRFATLTNRRWHLRDAFMALLAGGLMTLFTLTALAHPAESRLAPFFLENSLPLAKGHNVVNVILVDFRGVDTLGEITVLAVAAIGVYTLLRLTNGKPHAAKQTKQQDAQVEEGKGTTL